MGLEKNGEQWLTRIVTGVIVFRFAGSVWFDGSNQTECSYSLINKSSAQASSTVGTCKPVSPCEVSVSDQEWADDKEKGESRGMDVHR